MRFRFQLLQDDSQGIGLQVLGGSGFTPDNSNENEAATVAVRFGLVFMEDGELSFRIRDIEQGINSQEVFQKEAQFTFAINSTPEEKQITGPDGVKASIAPWTAALWVDNKFIALGISVGEDGRPLSDFAFFASGPNGMGTYSISDISITALE